MIGGTQDNGTEMFRNSPVFHHSDDGDGGYCLIDQMQPRNALSTYYGNSPKRSTAGGAFGTWIRVWTGIAGSSLQFYPPLAVDDTNPNNVAFGTDRINLDPAQGTSNWPTKVTLPGASTTNSVSAIHYVNANLIYAGTRLGSVYRMTKTGAGWSASAIHAAPLPAGAMVTDLSAVPGSPNTVVVVLSGFGTAAAPLRHVWRAMIAAGGTATWTSISGTGAGALPDIPVNALVIEPLAAATMYIATDVAVYRTTSSGTSWTPFSDGLPNVAVFDLGLHQPSRVLRAATHGRGLWERKLDVAALPDADIFFRDHLMSTARITPTPEAVVAAFDDPLHYVALGDPLYHWMCADIKVDALEGAPPSYQGPVSQFDYVTFETTLQHRNAQRGNVNRVYVQVHNRGFAPAANVTVKLLFAPAAAGLPPLPADFWTAFPNNAASASPWVPIGAAKTIASLSATAPAVLEWEWTTPASAPQHSCLLVVMDCPADPIPAGSKVFDVDGLVTQEKRAGLKNLHVVDAPSGTMPWRSIDLYGRPALKATAIRLFSNTTSSGAGILLPKSVKAAKATGLVVKKTDADDGVAVEKGTGRGGRCARYHEIVHAGRARWQARGPRVFGQAAHGSCAAPGGREGDQPDVDDRSGRSVRKCRRRIDIRRARLQLSLNAVCDTRGIDPTQDFTAEIENAIDAATYMVACITPDVKRDNSFVRREIGYAEAVGKPSSSRASLRLSPPIAVVNQTRFDFFSDWDGSFQRLLDFVRQPPGEHTFPKSQRPNDPFRPYLETLYRQIVRYLDKTVFAAPDADAGAAVVPLSTEAARGAVAETSAEALPRTFFEMAGVDPDSDDESPASPVSRRRSITIRVACYCSARRDPERPRL